MAVVEEQMPPGLWDLSDDAGQELEGVDFFEGRKELRWVVVGRLGRIENARIAGSPLQSGKAHRGAKHVSSDVFESFPFARGDANGIIDVETAGFPGKEKWAVAREGKVPMSHVARGLVMDRTTFYRAVAPLLRAGDLRWEPSGEDGRAKLLQLSRSGRRHMDQGARRWAAAQRRMVRKIGLDQWRELSRGLLEVTENALALQPLDTDSRSKTAP